MINWMLKTFFLAKNEFLQNNEIFYACALEHAGGWC